MLKRLASLVVVLLAFTSLARAQTSADAGLTMGITQLKDGHWNEAVLTLTEVVKRLSVATARTDDLAQAHLWLGSAHGSLWQQARAAATPDDARTREQARKAIENYKKFLTLNQGAAETPRRMRPLALSALLGIYLFEDHRDEAALGYADELAREPSLVRRDIFILVGVYSLHGRPDLCEPLLKRQLAADPSDAQACQGLAGLYNTPVWKGQTRFDDTIATLERCAAQSPADPTGYYVLATFLWDKAYRDQALSGPQRLNYAERGLGHIEKALSLKKDFYEAVVYKGLLLRVKAMAVSDTALRDQLMVDALALQKRAAALRASGVPPHPGLPTTLGPPPRSTPATAAVGGVSGGIAEGVVGGLVGSPRMEPIRVGGQVKEPRKLKDVPAVYPPIAIEARVRGLVILECTIGPEGNGWT